MSDKVARLGIERDNDLMYYIKNGDVWATPRKKPGKPKGKPTKIESAGIEMDYSKYIYFLDGDGDISRKARASGGGGKRKAAKAPKAPKAVKTNGNGNGKKSARAADCPPCPPIGNGNGNGKRGGKKTEAQLDAEVDEILATTKPKPRGKKR